MKKVLFICRANIGRSQMAEGYYNFFAGKKLAMSAAVEDFAEKYHHRPTTEIIATMHEEGIDISQQKIKQLDESMLCNVDTVIVFCSKEDCPQYLLKNNKVKFIHIPDPFGQTSERIREIRNEIKSIVLDVLNNNII